MDPADIVKNRVSESRGLYDSISSYIPLYRGYKEKNDRRLADREVRMFVVRALEGVKMDLGNVHRDVIDSGNMKRAIAVERLRVKVDTHSTKIEKAVSGYSGLMSTIKKLDNELECVMQWDANLLKGADDLKKMSNNLMNDTLSNDIGLDVSIREIENNVDDLLELFVQRDAIIKGLGGE